MRLHIRQKIFILGFGLTFILVFLAFALSFFIYKDRVEKKYNESVKTSISLTEEWLSDLRISSESYSTTESRSDVFNYVLKTYNDLVANDPNYPGLDSTKTQEDLYNYVRTYYSDLFPAQSGSMGMSRQGPANRSHYASLKSDMVSALGIADGITGQIVYFDEKNDRYLMIVNTIFRFDDENHVGPLPGSYEQLDEYDHNVIKAVKEKGVYQEGNTSIYFVDFKEAGTDRMIARAILEFDSSVIHSTIKAFGILLAISLVGISILLVIFYTLFAHIMVVKNVNKLHLATNQFKEDLLNNRSLNVIKTNINTHDEIRMLSDSFEMLEDDIISYAKRIEEETSNRLKMQSELEIASNIQLGALPPTSLSDKNVSLRTSIKSAKEVGGDFYDYFYIDDNHLAIVISDVSGKGIPAALFMMKAKELIRSKLYSNETLEQACFDINNILLRNNKQGLFITAFIGILDIKTNILKFVNAGHERPFVINDKEVKQLTVKSNFILGGVDNFEYQVEEIKLKPNDKLFLHTDGLNEAINNSKEEFGYQRILNVLNDNKDDNLDNTIHKMNEELSNFVLSEEQFDDVTMLLLEIKDNKLHFKFTDPSYDIIEKVSDSFNDYYSYINNKVLSEVNIIFDELLNNYISYEKVKPLIIEIDISIVKDELVFEFRNNGEEFNPLEKKDKVIEEFDPNMPVGGLGITIIKNLSNEVLYERKDNMNHLTIKKSVN